MKKTTKKLKLGAETLRNLDHSTELNRAVGGTSGAINSLAVCLVTSGCGESNDGMMDCFFA